MFKMIANLFGGNILGGVNKILGRFITDKDRVEANIHNEQIAVQGAFAAEWHQRNSRTWWDSFWDGVNRMPRPLMVTMTIALFFTAYYDPAEFMILMAAFSTVPDWLAMLLGAITLFYFGSRAYEKAFKIKGPSAAQMSVSLELIDKIREREENEKKELNRMGFVKDKKNGS